VWLPKSGCKKGGFWGGTPKKGLNGGGGSLDVGGSDT